MPLFAPVSPSGPAGGDLAGTYPDPTLAPGAVDWSEIFGKPATFPPTVPIAWDDITGEPVAFPPTAHGHAIADTTGLQTALDAKEPVIAGGTTAQFWRGDKTWQVIEAGGAPYIGDAPPGSPTVGQLWWESDTGNLFIWYNDGTSSQWVPASVGAQGPPGQWVQLTQAAYNALSPPNPATLYVIVG